MLVKMMTPKRENETPNSPPHNKEKIGKIHAQIIFVILGNCVDIFNSLATARSDFHFIF